MITGVVEIFAGITLAKTFEWLWDKYGETIVTASAQKLKTQWEKFPFRPAAKKYAEAMKEQYGIIQIWRMPESVSLEGLYTQTKVSKELSTERGTSLEQLQAEFLGEEEKEGQDGYKMVFKYPKLFLWGKPGSGKTTFLNYLTLQATDGDLKYVPIFIPLRVFFASGKSLFDFIVEQFDICDFPDAAPFIKTILKKGKAIVLCDGLDEVPKAEGKQGEVAQALTDFSNKYDDSRFVITCRVAGTERFFKGFKHIQMADFDDDQQRTFAKNWFKTTENPYLTEEPTKRFFKEFDAVENKRLRDLAKNPLLLTLLCIAFQETGQLSQKRSEIYEDAIDAMVRKWNISRGIIWSEISQYLSPRQEQQMFAHIAAKMFEDETYLFEQGLLKDLIKRYLQKLPNSEKYEGIDEIEIIKAIEAEHGIFVQCARRLYSFSHLTFQEYFTALYIKEHVLRGTLNRLIENHWNEENWREVFLLTAEMLSEADTFFEIFLSKLDEYIDQNKILVPLLHKVTQEEKQKKDIEPFELHSKLIVLVIKTAFLLSPGAVISDLDRIEASKDLTSRARASTRAKKSTLTLDHDLANVVAGAQMLAHTEPASDSHKKEYDEFCNYHRRTLMSAERHGLTSLFEAIDALPVPQQDDSLEQWDAFTTSFTDILKTHHSLEEYRLTADQFNALKQYVLATHLVWECLKSACVSDRTVIKERLLHPSISETKSAES